MDVAVLGVSAEAEQFYRYFLQHPGDEVGPARQALGIDPDTAEAAIESLSRLALLNIGDRHNITATEPRIGIERLIEQRVEQLNNEIRRVLAAREVIASLQRDQEKGELSTPALGIERVEGLDQVRQRLDDLAFFSYKETLCLHPGGPLSAGAIETALPLDTRSLRRGLRLRSVYHPRALEDPAMEKYLHDIAGLGGEVRITADPMDRMLIFDRGIAVVPMDPKDSSRGALLVREAGLVAQMLNYFDGIWQAATDLQEHTEPTSGPPLLSGLEKQVLSALANSDKDEIAARELNISVRTYRRHVADLMARLNAVNRFQAALRAKEEGWI